MGEPKQKPIEDQDTFLDELPAGTELLHGQFKIEKFLNSGGFGMTYLATDSLDRKVVIKECFPSSFCNRSRTIVQARSRAHTAELRSVVNLFVQEARSLAKLDHPNIVGVHQVFEDNDTAYMALDYVEGRDLLDMIEDKDHGLTAPQIKGILKDVLGAVGFIHSHDILHRDISPDNILLDDDLRPVLIDFGAAREEATKKSRVLSQMRVVKDGYSPQEFYIQGSEQFPSSDLYSLAATFFHLIDGDIPPNSQARLSAIATGDKDPYQPLAGRIKGYDTRFLTAIDKALAILPKERVQSAEEWLDMMESNRRKSRVLSRPVPVSSAAAETAASAKRSRKAPLLGAVAVIALIAGAGFIYMNNPQAIAPMFEDRASATTPAVEADDVVAVSPDAIATSAPSVPETPAPQVQAAVTQPAAESDQVADPAPLAEVVVSERTVERVEPTPLQTPAQDVAFASTASAEAAVEPVVPPADATEPSNVAEATTGIQTLAGSEAVADSDLATTPEVETAASTAIDSDPVIATMAETEATAQTDNESLGEVVTETVIAADADVETASEAVIATAAETDAVAETANEPLTTTETEIAAVADVASDSAPVTEVAPAADSEVAIATATDDVTPIQIAGEPGFRVDLPFTGVPGSAVIANAAVVAPVWVRPGDTVSSVNGIGISTIAQIDTVLAAQTADPYADPAMDLEISIRAAADGSISTHAWTVPVYFELALTDGTVFRTALEDGEWTTRVSQIGEATQALQVGDHLVAYLPTTETLTERLSLHDIVKREASRGTGNLNFAVSRDGSMWVVSLTAAADS